MITSKHLLYAQERFPISIYRFIQGKKSQRLVEGVAPDLSLSLSPITKVSYLFSFSSEMPKKNISMLSSFSAVSQFVYTK